MVYQGTLWELNPTKKMVTSHIAVCAFIQDALCLGNSDSQSDPYRFCPHLY